MHDIGAHETTLHEVDDASTAAFARVFWGRNADAKTPGSRLMALIRAAYEQTGKTVVVLVDEYDAPLLNVAHDPEKLHAFRLAMREFFAPLKACDEYLRFVFLTGITFAAPRPTSTTRSACSAP